MEYLVILLSHNCMIFLRNYDEYYDIYFIQPFWNSNIVVQFMILITNQFVVVFFKETFT